jgi:UDP-3-O-[3-hydroxymyristoyl] glucosamine N-acyltransferase
MVRFSFVVWAAMGSVSFASDVNLDGCQDEFALNGGCVDLDATVHGSSSLALGAAVLEGAFVGPEVALGADVVVAARASLAGRVAHVSNPLSVGAGTVIGRNAQLGADHVLGDDVTIGRAVVAGARLTIATAGTLGYAAQVGTDVNIGAGAVVGNLVTLGDFTTLGDNAVVARSVTIADGISAGNGATVNGIVGPDVLIAAGSRIEQGARVRKQTDIGAGAAIEASARIGRAVVIESGATVYGRVAPNGTVGAGATVESGSKVGRGGEVCSGTTLPTGSQVASDGTWPDEGCSAIRTCQTIKTSAPSSVDGVYNVDPDGPGGFAAFNVWCDMETNGGGWTYVAEAGRSRVDPLDTTISGPNSYHRYQYDLAGMTYDQVLVVRGEGRYWCNSWGNNSSAWTEPSSVSMGMAYDTNTFNYHSGQTNPYAWIQQSYSQSSSCSNCYASDNTTPSDVVFTSLDGATGRFVKLDPPGSAASMLEVSNYDAFLGQYGGCNLSSGLEATWGAYVR